MSLKTYICKTEVGGVDVTYTYDIKDGEIIAAEATFYVGGKHVVELSTFKTEADMLNEISVIVWIELDKQKEHTIRSFYGDKSLYRRVVNAVLKRND